MQRRDFLKFMGVSAGATAAANALAIIPEAEKQIILLDKPNDIIIANQMPDVDFVISDGIKNINYESSENITMYNTVTQDVPYPSLGHKSINISLEYYAVSDQVNLYKSIIEPSTFTFNLKMEDLKYFHLMELNGRKFMLSEYTILAHHKDITEVQLSAIEVAL